MKTPEENFVTCPACLGKGFDEFEDDRFGFISSICYYCDGIVSLNNYTDELSP